MTLSRSSARLACMLPLFMAAACARDLPSAPEPEPPAEAPMQRLVCSADRAAASFHCGPPPAAVGGAAGDLIVGGQGSLVRLSSSGLVVSADSVRVQVSLQNLLGQAIGTTDGTSVAPGGIRVFLIGPPTVTRGTGSVAVVPDGTASFTAENQAYYQYGQVLAPNAASAARPWRFATSGGVEAFTFSVYVSAPIQYPDGWVQVAPAPVVLPVGTTTALAPAVYDRLGRVQAGQTVRFQSANPSVAAVDSVTGALTGVALGTTVVTATSGARSGSVSVSVVRPVATVFLFTSASMMVGTTAQTTVLLRDASGNTLTGRPIQYTSSDSLVATISPTGLVRARSPGPVVLTATSEGRGATANVTVTSAPAGIVRMEGMAAGANHTCGLVSGGAAFCWGPNADGQLGAGLELSAFRNTPVAVAGGLSFTQLTSGHYRTCGIAAGGAAWCWGRNESGALGTGGGENAAVPTPVLGGHAFASLATARTHTCGITTAGAAYCWGENGSGQLGDGTTDDRAQPVAVAGGHLFTAITATWDHTCALKAGGAAYCWGANPWGGLGSGAREPSTVPVAVTGGLAFASLSAGMSYTCGVTAGGVAYCWGDNSFAQLGNGLETSVHSSNVPVPVSGGITFAAVAAAGRVGTCGLAVSGAAYCWGRNDEGKTLGTGPGIGSSNVPAAVAGGLSFAGVSAGGGHTCGVTSDGFAYCWGAGSTGALGQGAYVGREYATPVARGEIPAP